jgi:hypothetical protein
MLITFSKVHEEREVEDEDMEVKEQWVHYQARLSLDINRTIDERAKARGVVHYRR